MRVTYDTEFIEDGKAIRLISIGLVSEDGREYYAVASDAPWERIAKHRWLCENVVPSLPLAGKIVKPLVAYDSTHVFSVDTRDIRVKPAWVIANEVREFVLTTPDLELWAWYAAFDHVALAWLWGPMSHLPPGIPMWTNDIRQEAHRLGLTDADMPQQEGGVHNALADARHNLVRLRYLEQVAAERP